MKMPDLSISIDGIRFKNPLILASGILGSKKELLNRIVEAGIGGLTTKSFTREPREGYKTPIIAYAKAGLLNAVGLSNPGYKSIPDITSGVKDLSIPIIVSIAASKPEDFSLIASYAEDAGADAVELNLSCPHVKGHGLEIGQDPGFTGEIVKTVSSMVSIPVFIKVGVFDNLMETISKAVEGGAEAIVAINTVKAIAIDVYAKKPILSNVYGGLSGPAIHPIAVRVVYDVYKEFDIPIIGVGGVSSWTDAIEFLLAGASAVGIGTAIGIYGIDVIEDILMGIEDYMVSEGFSTIKQLVGYVHRR